jgi:hypothetical protein
VVVVFFSVLVVAVVAVVPVVPVAVVPVSVVSVVAVPVPVIAVPDVSVDDIVLVVLVIAVPDVSLVVIVDDVSLAAVSVMLVFSSFLHANMKVARANTIMMTRVFFMNDSFPRRMGLYDWDWMNGYFCGACPHLLARSSV